MSRTRDIANILGKTEAENTTNISLGAGGGGGGATSYANAAALPTSGNTAGDLAFTLDKNALFNWDGTEWDRIYSGPNEVPTWDSALPSGIALSSSGTPTVVAFKADPDIEGFPINYSYETVPANPAQLDSAYGEDSGGSVGTGILDSSDHATTPRITLKPSSDASHAGAFTLRVKANDGSHVITSSSTVSLSFFEGDYFYIANATNEPVVDATSGVAATFGSAVNLATVNGYPSLNGGKTQNTAGGGVNNAVIFDLSTTGGFDATTDLIVFSFLLPSTGGACIGMGIYDDAAAKSITLAHSSGFGRLDGNFASFQNFGSAYGNHHGDWMLGMFGGGNAIASIDGTTSSGFRMWPVTTGGTPTLASEVGSTLTGPGGYSPPYVDVPGMVFWNGGDIGAYTSGYTSRNAMEWNIRSFQVYYDQTTSGKTVEQIVGKHQQQVFT